MITKILPSNVSQERYIVSGLDQLLIDSTGSSAQKDLWFDLKISPLCGLNHCYSSDFSGYYFTIFNKKQHQNITVTKLLWKL